MKQLVSDRGGLKTYTFLFFPVTGQLYLKMLKVFSGFLDYEFYSYSFHLYILLFLWWTFIILLFIHFLLNLY